MENYNQIQYVIGKDERHQEDNWWVNQWKKIQITEQTYAKLPKNIKPNYRTEGKNAYICIEKPGG